VLVRVGVLVLVALPSEAFFVSGFLFLVSRMLPGVVSKNINIG
jgi:hypothetical protein